MDPYTLIQENFSFGALQGVYESLRAIFILLDISLLAGFLYALRQLLKFRPEFVRRTRQGGNVITIKKAIYKEQWDSISRKASFISSDSMRLSIIEADALVDKLLKHIGFTGDHLADRLQKLNSAEMSSVERVWRAHKLRNRLVHSPGFKITAEEAKGALEDYESFFKELGVL